MVLGQLLSHSAWSCVTDSPRGVMSPPHPPTSGPQPQVWEPLAARFHKSFSCLRRPVGSESSQHNPSEVVWAKLSVPRRKQTHGGVGPNPGLWAPGSACPFPAAGARVSHQVGGQCPARGAWAPHVEQDRPLLFTTLLLPVSERPPSCHPPVPRLSPGRRSLLDLQSHDLRSSLTQPGYSRLLQSCGARTGRAQPPRTWDGWMPGVTARAVLQPFLAPTPSPPC